MLGRLVFPSKREGKEEKTANQEYIVDVREEPQTQEQIHRA